ncbi:MAG: helix-turn-helix domain-containing protein [Alphaproteobacteria bacterium]|nr:helix-turn-helix domain-containing protein [Alphaproteobacteria bacterium]
MSLNDNRQIRAARALLGWEQKDLAKAAGVNINTIRRMEGSDGAIRGNIRTLADVRTALENAGIEFLNHGSPGVRIRARSG